MGENFTTKRMRNASTFYRIHDLLFTERLRSFISFQNMDHVLIISFISFEMQQNYPFVQFLDSEDPYLPSKMHLLSAHQLLVKLLHLLYRDHMVQYKFFRA